MLTTGAREEASSQIEPRVHPGGAFDRSRAEEQLRADLGIREAVASETGDLGLLRGEVRAGLVGSFPGALACGEELALRLPFPSP
jgi:hypothetical protein